MYERLMKFFLPGIALVGLLYALAGPLRHADAQNRGTPQPNANNWVTASATGTTAATTATIPALNGFTAYLCGFSIRANATAAVTGDATVTGLMSGTLNFTQWTAPLASGLGITEPNLGSCIPASAQAQAIAVISAAPGTAGVVSVSAWGFYW